MGGRKMGITKKEVQYVADLARLNLSEEEAERLVQDMDSIIRYSMDKLKELDTDSVKPMEHVLPIRNVFREDVCENSFRREDVLKNAPSEDNGCFRVPKVVE
jgi:aspartyl-tRNA(Asn)/glutamyl-tRNA(Gln) amidotransferase subunit C